MHPTEVETLARPDRAVRDADPAPNPSPATRAARRSVHRSPAFAFFCAYSLFVAYATLLPFQFLHDGASLRAKTAGINWNPFVMVTGEPTPIADVVTNIALFVPLGFIAFHAQRRRSVQSTVWRGTAAGFALSAGVEVLQFFTPSRNPATSDVITNTLGAALGAMCAAWFRTQLERPLRRHARAWLLREPLLPVLAVWTVLVAMLALVPFDLAPTVSWLRHALRTAQLDPTRGAVDWADALSAAVRYALLAGLALRVAGRLEIGNTVTRLLGVWGGCTVLALGLEILQLVVRSRVATTRDVLAAVAGAAIGVILALALGGGRRSRFGWSLALGAFVACLAAQALSPFQFELELESMRARLRSTTLVPYSSYYYKATIAAVADFLEGLFAYAPVGFVLARARGGGATPRDAVPIVLWCTAYAFVLEVLQLGVPRRYPEVSDVLTAGLGAALGAYAWRWFVHLRTETPESADGPAAERSRPDAVDAVPAGVAT